MTYKEIKKWDDKLQEKHCYKCEHFYDGFICGFEISMDDEKDTMEDVMERRKNVCNLDKEPFEIRNKIYTNISR